MHQSRNNLSFYVSDAFIRLLLKMKDIPQIKWNYVKKYLEAIIYVNILNYFNSKVMETFYYYIYNKKRMFK